MTTNFNQFALAPALQDSLTAMNFDVPTPIQAMAIPLGLEGRDVLGSAQTGTGKTAAFSIPMINALINDPKAHALVMAPTRELATQVLKVARDLIGQEKGIKTALLIGGEAIGKQYEQLRRRPRLIVGTPGRINDHLRGNRELLDFVKFVVLDEADRMLDMGFAGQIDTILEKVQENRQTLMFSATFPDNIIQFSKKYLNNPERISVGTQGKPGENITQQQLALPQEQKHDALEKQLAERTGSIIIFVRTKHGADKLAAKLQKTDHKVEALHGGLRQRQRDKVVQIFRQGKVRILVATDVAARGLDIPHVEHVINYDLPQVADDYIHRIGRTARAGAKGEAISFISPGERGLWRDIERLLGIKHESFGDEHPDHARKKSFGKAYAKKPAFGRKPFGRGARPERAERKKPSWNPDGDFKRQDDKPRRDDGERSFKKPFRKKEDGEARSFDKPFRKPFKRDEDSAFKKPYRGKEEGGGFKKSYGSDSKPSYRKDEGSSFKKPYKKDGESSYKKPFKKDGESSYKKPFKKDDRADFRKPARAEGGFDTKRKDSGERPFKKDTKPSGKKPFRKDERPAFKGEKKPFQKSGPARSKPSSGKTGGDKPMKRTPGRTGRPKPLQSRSFK